MDNVICKIIKGNKEDVRVIIDPTNNGFYVSITDLISASHNVHCKEDVLAFTTNKKERLLKFNRDDSSKLTDTIFVDADLALEALNNFPTYVSPLLIEKINCAKKSYLCAQSMHIISDFEKKIPDLPEPKVYFLRPDNVAVPIYDIDDFNSLTQFLGYVKYENRFWGNVYLRGQDSLYDNGTIYANGTFDFEMRSCQLVPSVFRVVENRSLKKVDQLYTHVGKISRKVSCLDMIEEKLFPLLQHYGLKTMWLDIVDNIWVALWFSLYSFSSQIGVHNEFTNIRKRDSGYSYLFLILSDATMESINNPGCFYGKETMVTDLRKALPSVYLRPHAQHAFMIRKRNLDKTNDYSDLIVGIARIPVEKVYQWVGKSGLVSVQSLFPSPRYDYGYKKLLDEFSRFQDSSTMDTFGAIHLYSCDYF